MEPTLDPTVEPTVEPTYLPTLEPTYNPTGNPTMEPTTDPTNDPTFEPTVIPTMAPTFCLDAKYKGSMTCSDGECDSLWGGESLGSENCDYLMGMEMNGNLAVYANHETFEERRRLLTAGKPDDWWFGWSSNTSIANESGHSVPAFTVSSDGSLSILEYTEGADSNLHEALWSLETGVNSSFTLDLSAEGCLEVNVDSVSDAVWSMCSDFYTPTVEPTQDPTHQPIYTIHISHHSTTPFTTAEGSGAAAGDQDDDAMGGAIDSLTSGNFDMKYMVFYIIILILVCVICALCGGGCIYLQKN